MAQVKVGDDVFRVELDGPPDAPVLLLSNSLGTNLHMWDPQMQALTKHFHVVRYDSRGHGQSAAPEGPYSIEQLGRDALGLMDALGFERVSWMGLSKGGMVGQWLLAHAPERIERAVLANTAAQMGPPDGWNVRIRTAHESGMAAIAPTVIERWFTQDFREREPEAVQTILAMLDTTPPQGYAGCCAAIRDMDQREAIRAVKCPVLVIVGRHDPATPPEAGALIADSIAGAELVTLNAAHLSNIEDEAAFTRTVVNFLTRRGEERPPHSVAKAAKKAAKAAKKAVKSAKKSAKKGSRKAAKEATKTAAKKGIKKSVKKAPKTNVKKAAKGVKKAAKVARKGFRAKTFARASGKPTRGRTR